MRSKLKRTNSFLLISVLALLSLLLSACGAHVYHQVRKGDTLYSISWHYSQDYRQVAKWNGLGSSYTIKEGQWLRVAPPGPAAGLEPPVYVKAPVKTQSKISDKNISKTQAEKAAKHPVTVAKNTSSSSSLPSSSVAIAWQWPLKGKLIRKFNASKPGQQGVDISAAAGTPVHAAAGGKVVYSGNGLRGYGNLLIIKHNDKYLSAYAHNKTILVKEGVMVKKGQQIARVGSTESKQIKLHFQIRVDGRPADPLRFLPR